MRTIQRAIGAAAFVLILGVAGLLALPLLGGLLPHPSNPFPAQRADRSPAPVLKALNDLSEYRAATASYQQVVDLEKGNAHIPSFLKGERTTYLAIGDVEATVDFRTLGAGAVSLSPNGTSVTVSLPKAHVGRPRLDLRASRVVDHDRGLLDRVGGLVGDSGSSEHVLQVLAEDKLVAAATADPGLVDRAEANTRTMLVGLLHGLGFTDITVTFQDLPA